MTAGSLPTVADVLEFPAVLRGRPRLVAGHRGARHRVRWAHVSELPDIAHLLQGGELILSTGLGLSDDPELLRRYVQELAEVGASGVIIELGRRFTVLPPAILTAADHWGLPIVALHAEVPFVAVTEAIHSIIVADEVRQLRLSENIHSTFQMLSTESSSADDVVAQVARMARRPAVLENLSHHVLACSQSMLAGDDALEDWAARSRQVEMTSETVLAEPDGWLVTPVGARGHTWGRLVLLVGDVVEPQHRAIVEQGATTLALHRLIHRDQPSLEHQVQRNLIADIMDRRYASPDEVRVRARALGLETRGRRLVGLVVLTDREGGQSELARHERARQELAAVSAGLEDVRAHGLVGGLRPGQLAVALAMPPGADDDEVLHAVAVAIRARLDPVVGPSRPAIGVGSVATDIDHLRVSLFEASDVADASCRLSLAQPFARATDIRLRGLVHQLRDDERLQAFAERELGRILGHDEECGTALFATLVAFLETNNKTDAARVVGVSRPTFYQHLAQIEHLLGVDLQSSESRASLYVAALAIQASGERPAERPLRDGSSGRNLLHPDS